MCVVEVSLSSLCLNTSAVVDITYLFHQVSTTFSSYLIYIWYCIILQHIFTHMCFVGEVCCLDSVEKRVSVGLGDSCCGGRPFVSGVGQICCGGRLYDGFKSQCCGGQLVPRETECCGDEEEGISYEHVSGDLLERFL